MIDEIYYLDQINNETKLKNVIDHYDAIYEVNLAYIDILIKNNHYDDALERINKSFLNERRDHVIEECHNKKKQIYLKQGDKVHYLEELQDLFMIYNPGNLDLYHELKQNYSKEQWLKSRERLLKPLKNTLHIGTIYKELLDYVLNSEGLYQSVLYINDLKDLYSQEVLEKYYYELNNIATSTSSRSQYKEYVDTLERMKSIAGGTKVVQRIYNEWRSKYPRRKVMMEELSKLKI